MKVNAEIYSFRGRKTPASEHGRQDCGCRHGLSGNIFLYYKGYNTYKGVKALASEAQTPVRIHLITTVKRDDDSERYEMVLFGRCYRRNDTLYLKYDEAQEEGVIHTLLKAAPNSMSLLRKGAVEMKMSFQPHEQMEGSHVSEFGSLLLSTHTKEMMLQEDAQACQGNIGLRYDLYMQGAFAGEYHMEIEYKEETAK